MLEQYKNRRFIIGQDCLDPGVKRAKIENKAKIIERGSGTTDEMLLAEAWIRSNIFSDDIPVCGEISGFNDPAN